MVTRSDVDNDDDFSEIYKEYTGPARSTVNNAHEKVKSGKLSLADSEDEDSRDPNAVPTDFTSREAKAWEAKSKATERNWKKRKEEEMICKICGESGHFTQGCPSTLGANRKAQDFFERVPARDKSAKALLTGKVLQRIECDIGCKVKMEEKFIIVSGKDKLILSKGVDAVYKVIKGEGGSKGSSSSRRSRSRSPEESASGSWSHRSGSYRSYPGQSRDVSHNQKRLSREDKVVDDHAHEDLRKFSRSSPQAHGNDGTRGRSSHSKSPACHPYAGNISGPYDGRGHSMVDFKFDTERQGTDLQQPGHRFGYSTFPQALLDEVEVEYMKEAVEITLFRDKEEDEEIFKHREAIREMRDKYVKKLAFIRGTHLRKQEEIFQLDAQRREIHAQQQLSLPGFDAYKREAYPIYDGSSTKSHYSVGSLPMDSRLRHMNHVDTYPPRHNGNYVDFQHHRHEEFGKAYNQY